MTIDDLDAFTKQLKQQAAELGFVLAGVTPAVSPARLGAFHRWLDAGYAGSMSYLENRREAYAHPDSVLDGCSTLVMLALPYEAAGHSRMSKKSPSHQTTEAKVDSPSAAPTRGKIARYARMELDYHDVIHDKLKVLRSWVSNHHPAALVRGIVDTAPLLEREFAELAGLGWVGKNTLLLNRTWGSYFFLAALLTDLELVCDPPSEKGYCGTCTACLDACPTHAFPEPYVLDGNRCISYLTIEHRSHIADDLKAELGDWLFGCDICQEVCPWNCKRADEPVSDASRDSFELGELLSISEEEFRIQFRKTPMWRSRRRGLLRNALLLCGTQRLSQHTHRIVELLSDEEPLLRAAAAWAIARIQPENWTELLSRRMSQESDESVQSELRGLSENYSL